MTPAFFALLMRDASTLLRPSVVVPLTEASDTSTKDGAQMHASHPTATTLLALSDVSALLQPPHSTTPSGHKHKPSPVAAKLAFYAARVMATPTYILKALADEIAVRATLIEREGTLNGALEAAKVVKNAPAPANENIEKVEERKAKIVELS